MVGRIPVDAGFRWLPWLVGRSIHNRLTARWQSREADPVLIQLCADRRPSGRLRRHAALQKMSSTNFRHDHLDPFRWMERSVWQWFPALRWLQRCLICWGVGNVEFSNDAEIFWRGAMGHAPISFRWFGSSLSVDDVDAELAGCEQ